MSSSKLSNVASQLGLIGAGGQALEVADYCGRKVLFHAVDLQFLALGVDHVSIDDPGDAAIQVDVVVAVGAPGAKRDLANRWPGRNFTTVVAQSAYVACSARIGEGSVIAPNATIMASVVLGRHVSVGAGVIISHESAVGDFSTISPGATIGGKVTVEDGVFVGIGATIRDGVTIGCGSVIGAGSVVIANVTANQVVVGVPGHSIKTLPEWIYQI